jgi:DNA-binding CsgD family transcriptional regulator
MWYADSRSSARPLRLALHERRTVGVGVSGEAVARAELSEAAASTGPDRGRAMLAVLRGLVPYDGAWLALADPDTNSYTSVASADLDDRTVRYLCGPETARDIDLTGTNRHTAPLSPSDLPYPVEELTTWATCLVPAGFHESLSVALYACGGRHVGFLTLLSGTRQPPPPERRDRLGRLTSVLAQAIDPLRSLLPATRLVQGATAGVVLRADGGSSPLPGLDGHPLLEADSPPVAVARSGIESGTVYASFLWPLNDDSHAAEHVRVTALAGTEDAPAIVAGMVLLSPPGNLHGLTPRELEVLGHVISGSSNAEIARALVVAQRTVAAHIEHILTKLAAPSRTLAAVRAEREGVYIPPVPRRNPPAHGPAPARPGAPPARSSRPRP